VSDLFLSCTVISFETSNTYLMCITAVPIRMYRDILIAKGKINITSDYSNFTVVTGDFDPAIFDLGPEICSRACATPQPSETCPQSSPTRIPRKGKWLQ
jgi:hypothetical protein